MNFSRKATAILIFIVSSLFGFAQSKKVWIELADDAYARRDYANAAEYYSKVLDDTTVLRSYVLPYEPQLVNLLLPSLLKVPELAVTKKQDSTNIAKEDREKASKYDFILYRLAQSYRLNYDYLHAVPAFRKCVDRKAYVDAGYYYGLSLLNIKDYNAALKAFDSYVQEKSGSDSLMNLAVKKETSCYFALDTLIPKKTWVHLMDTLVFNAGTSNFAPMYYLGDEKLIFTSARKGGVVVDPEVQDSRYFCDLYYSVREDTIWLRPVNFGRPVNTSLHEGAAVFTPEEVMLFTRWSDNNRNEAFIYMARTNGGKFYEAMKLGPNVNKPGFKSHQPFVTTDGRTLFFSSNRPGGKGGFDIWTAPIDENGFIGEAANIGGPVNTEADEVSPFFHDISGTLFFSSNGHPGLGGLDVFKSAFNADDSVYQVPVNLNQPVNSSMDDSYYITDKFGVKGFFASDRKPCVRGHCYNIYSYSNEPIKFDIDGHVYDSKTNEPIASALLTIRDVHEGEDPIFLTTDAEGYYRADLRSNAEYFLKVQKNKFLGRAGSAITKGYTDSHHFEIDFYLEIIPEGDMELEEMEYDFGKATLRPKSIQILDKVVDFLKLNDNIRIELSSHTDSRGNDSYNLRLSQERAQSCVDYMVSKGIATDRVIAKGYGETKPVILQSEIDKLPYKSSEWESAHQKNRRTAFRIIGETNLKIINKTE
jgi:OOP family OmpA-OmpF porin